MGPRVTLCATLLVTLWVAPTSGEDDWSKGAFVRLFRQSDVSVKALGPSEIRLSTRRVRVREGDSIESLLQAGGILPNAESFGAVYTLNPELDPRALVPGRELALPAADGGAGLAAARKDGYLVALTLDVPGKQDLLDQVVKLEDLSGRFASLDSARFPSAAARAQSVEDLETTVNLLRSVKTVIRGQTRPLDPELLWQLRMESKHVASVLAAVFEGQRPVTAADARTLHLVAESMRIRAEHFRRVRGPGDPPERYARVRVAVRTVGAGRRAMDGLRIYYAPEALYEVPSAVKPFRELSPAAEYLVEANYRIWAARSPDPRPASEVLAVPVRVPPAGNELPVELVVLPK